MPQLKSVVDPFGEVNVHSTTGNRLSVKATILMEPHKEGAQTGIALDGSGSMRKLYGLEGGGRILSPIFGGQKKLANEITPIAQKVCAKLARDVDADEGTTVIYWAVGQDGREIEVVGDFSASEAEHHTFGPPKDFGTGTRLLPAVKYFVERFKTAPWGFYVFVTDGELHDLEEVIAYSKSLCQDIAAGRRKPVKLVLVGVGAEIAKYQLEALDDLDSGTNIDLWDHKLAAEMRVLEEIFAEVVDENVRVADNGRILDAKGKVVKDYSDVGLPALLEFELPGDSEWFTLEVNGRRIHQSVSDGRSAPQAGLVTLPVPEPAPKPFASSASQSQSQSPTQVQGMIEELPVDSDDPTAAEWKDLPLEFSKEGLTQGQATDGIDLQREDNNTPSK